MPKLSEATKLKRREARLLAALGRVSPEICNIICERLRDLEDKLSELDPIVTQDDYEKLLPIKFAIHHLIFLIEPLPQ